MKKVEEEVEKEEEKGKRKEGKRKEKKKKGKGKEGKKLAPLTEQPPSIEHCSEHFPLL